uniref:Uncharacterized protein n=1 Tax=Oryza meridionalis TaxID=40149 RepID=A0A0E0F6N9_9ORYZ
MRGGIVGQRDEKLVWFTENLESAVFQSVGSGLPETTWHSASTHTSRHRTSTVGGRTPTLRAFRTAA